MPNMALPIDLILVRHGQSEGNAAKRLAEKGDNSGYEKLKDKHTRSYRLSAKGRGEAIQAGKWIREEFHRKDSPLFDRYITSEYTRAMETSALLDLPEAEWFRNFYLTERDWGDLEQLPDDERMGKFEDALRMRVIEPFFWRPPNGESFANLCLRLDRVLYTLHRECSDMRVILVCHGEVMRAFRVLLERMPQQKFKEMYLSEENEDRVFNCEVWHYTRRDPETGKIDDHANWMRRIRPTVDPVWIGSWERIKRPRFSNKDLLDIVSETEANLE